ncbi:MAG TPA: BON domain-containing protein [Granulicella sp.]|jgi:hyperosmotically inducible protein|nr:BON domain-containing protein [Granulicella sp.]
MRLLRSAILALFAAVLLCPVNALSVAQPSSSQTAPDNSSQNNNQARTAEDQSNATADRQMTAKVRRAIMADKDLSTYAHNVKIITSNGNVTLTGPVKSEEEDC